MRASRTRAIAGLVFRLVHAAGWSPTAWLRRMFSAGRRSAVEPRPSVRSRRGARLAVDTAHPGR